MSPLSTMTVFTLKTPAKINLYLEIVNQRPDGYHNILSCMQMIGLYDRLTFEPRSKGIRLTLQKECVDKNEPPLASDRSNLVYQAATLLQKEARRAGHRVPGASILLVKRIPIAAGLAGGSSNAAAALIGLNRLWSLGWKRSRLTSLGARIGSDVPFFLGAATAWVSGRGEQVKPASLPLDFPRYGVLVDPKQQISTAWVYQEFSHRFQLTKSASRIRMLRGGSTAGGGDHDIEIGSLLRRSRNDLEAVTISYCPMVAKIKMALYSLGGRCALMSGSGTACFAFFRQHDEARKAADSICSNKMGTAVVFRVLRCSPLLPK